jgi:predicted transcriptional regulator of viral defense system
MKTRLGQMESQLLAYAQMRNLRTVRFGDLAEPLGLTRSQERYLLSRLAKAGIIARVQRGLYLLPPRLPLGGIWDPGEALALTALMEEQKAKYQVCGPNTFNRYRFDEQIPVRTYAYNTRISGDRMIGKVALTLIKVAERRLGDTEESLTRDGPALIYSSRVRSLVDAVYDWSRFDSLPRGYNWIRKELAAGRIEAEQLVESTVKFGDIGTIRRIGFLLERENIEERSLRKLERKLKPTTGPIPWIPTNPKTGRTNKRWGVVDNERT